MKTNFQEAAINTNGNHHSFPATGNLNKSNSLWAEGPLSSFLITGEATQGQAALLETIQKKGFEPPLHRHPETDETFYVIAGQMTFYIDGQSIAAPAGATVFIERGKEHTFTVETATANTLVLLTPAVNRA